MTTAATERPHEANHNRAAFSRSQRCLALRANFGLEPAAIGVIFGGLTIVFIALQPPAIFAVRRLGAQVTIATGLVISAVALLLVAVSSSLIASVLALASLALGVCLIALPGLQLLALTGQQQQTAFSTPGNSAGTHYGAIFAAYNLAYAVGLFLGPLLAGVTNFGSCARSMS
jgi:MFS family permease